MDDEQKSSKEDRIQSIKHVTDQELNIIKDIVSLFLIFTTLMLFLQKTSTKFVMFCYFYY